MLISARPKDADYTIHRMILGTHTDGDVQNQLCIAEVFLPKGGLDPGKDVTDVFDENRQGTSSTLSIAYKLISLRAWVVYQISSSDPHKTNHKSRRRSQQSSIHASKSGYDSHENETRRGLDIRQNKA
jgi:hypothetical protein